MTSSSIHDIHGLSYGQGAGRQNKKIGFQEEELAGMFQNAMNLAKDNSMANMSESGNAKSLIQTDIRPSVVANNLQYEYDTDNTVSNQADDNQIKDTKTDFKDKLDTKDTETTETTEVDGEVRETVEDKAEDLEDKVVKEVADKLDVSEEDVKKAMEELGLSVFDLMDQSKMAMLVTALQADGDSMALLTDENMFAGIVELTNTVKELINEEVSSLSQDLSIDFEDALKLLMEKVDGVNAEEGTNRADVLLEAEPEKPQVVYEVETVDDGEADADVLNATDANEAMAETGTQEDGASQMGGKQEQSDTPRQNPVPVVNPFQTQNPQMAQQISSADLHMTSGVNTQDIIDQIAERVRINIGSDFSEIEIALNPASLGNVHLQVAQKEGVITAVITTENEAVRDALLVQALILKEELNEQGLKVESVEVTVASHSFEQNMQGESGEEAQQLYEEQVKKQTRQRLIISDMNEAREMLEDESLSDAQRIQLDMMMKNGGSMDVMA